MAGLLVAAHAFSHAQVGAYSYQRELRGISGQWHKIILPDEVFGKTSPDLADIRIIGITASRDTVEAPYLLRLATEKISTQEVAFRTLNTARNDQGYYFTFEVPTREPINQIQLDFRQDNFDWRIQLKGSQDQREWFTVAENYRILSIKNELTDFQFTELAFPSAQYRFFRLLVKSTERPELLTARIAQHQVEEGTLRDYPIQKMDVKENRKAQQTEIDLALHLPVPLSHLRIEVADTFDYYRPMTIQYLADSTHTEKGWQYSYRTLASGTLNSMQPNAFEFSSTQVQKLKIRIHHHDNQPLRIGTVQASGYVHELLVRFTEPATYFLAYGNEAAARPLYDIDRFADKAPAAPTTLTLGDEMTTKKEEIPLTEPLFQHKAWLWAIMGVIILLLGWFSLKMMGKN